MEMVEMEDKDRQEATARIWDLLFKGGAVTLLLFVLSLRYAGIWIAVHAVALAPVQRAIILNLLVAYVGLLIPAQIVVAVAAFQWREWKWQWWQVPLVWTTTFIATIVVTSLLSGLLPYWAPWVFPWLQPFLETMARWMVLKW